VNNLRLSSRVKVSLAIVGSVALGLLIGTTILSNAVNGSASGNENQGLLLSGTATFKVLGPDGSLVSQWTGPDPLTNAAINAIAACLPGSDGGSTDPIGPGSPSGASGSCSSFVSAAAVVFGPMGTGCTENGGAQTENSFSVTGCVVTAPATNTLTPVGCDPNASTGSTIPPLCTGWITEATFGPATFTSTNCNYGVSQTPCAVLEVATGVNGVITNPSYGPTNGFDQIFPTPISLSSGDSLLVTIQFTVS
jgi:hypothetical protein